MKTQRLLVVLTLVNLALLIFTLARTRPASAEVSPVLRGRALEIVDERGRVRASIGVLPAEAQEHETVLLRLITERGRPVAKLVPPDPPKRRGVPDLTAFRRTMPVLDPPLSSTITGEREDRA